LHEVLVGNDHRHLTN